MKRVMRHVSPGLAIGLVALSVALGGVAMAGGAGVGASKAAPPKLIYKTSDGQVGPDSVNGELVLCGKGTHVVGGGVSGPGANTNVWVVSSQPVDSGDKGDAPDDAWYGFVDNEGNSDASFQVYAVCARGVAATP